MIEVYSNSSHTLTLDLGDDPAGNVVVVTVTDLHTNTNLYTTVPATRTGVGEYSFILPTSATRYDRKLRVTWSFDEDELVQHVEVVTPYTTPDEVRAQFPELADKTDAELIAMEQTVRNIIDVFVGESFGNEVRTITVDSSTNLINLQRRMYRLDAVHVNGQEVTGNYTFSGQFPYQLRYSWEGSVGGVPMYYDIKSDTYYSRLAWHSPGIFSFTITGAFGWEYVPSEVQLAARLLVRDYFTAEARWRESGIDVMRAADWRVEFASHPRNTTGNVNADMILEKYRRLRIFAI